MTDPAPTEPKPGKPPPKKKETAIGCAVLAVLVLVGVPMCFGKGKPKAHLPLPAKVADFPAGVPLLAKLTPKRTARDGIDVLTWEAVSVIGSPNWVTVEDRGGDGVADTVYMCVGLMRDRNDTYLEGMALASRIIEIATGAKVEAQPFADWVLEVVGAGKGTRRYGDFEVSAGRLAADKGAIILFTINEPTDKQVLTTSSAAASPIQPQAAPAQLTPDEMKIRLGEVTKERADVFAKIEKFGMPQYLVRGTIRDRDGATVQVWGKSFSIGNTPPAQQQGASYTDASLIVRNCEDRMFLGADIFSGEVWYAERSKGKNGFGADVKLLVFDADPAERKALWSQVTALNDEQADLNLRLGKTL